MNDNSFFSLDKLMEFGMSLAVAQQMIGMMNHSLNQMYVPNAGMSIGYEKTGYYALVNDKTTGPLDDEEIKSLVGSGSITSETFLWKKGMTGWKQAVNIPDVYKFILLNDRKPS